MQGKCIAWAMAVLTAGLMADAMAQTNDAPPGPAFMFRRTLPLDPPLHEPQRAYSWSYTPPSSVYGPPAKAEAEPARRSTESRSTKWPCEGRPLQPIPDTGFDAYMEYRALNKGLTQEADMRRRDRAASWPGYCASSGP
jgi:hypothetical protein